MRLIDADNFENRIYHEVFEKDSDMQKWDSGCWIRYKLVENVLREQPTIASEPHWIPVTERLPEERDWYLGTFKEPDTGWINPIPFICDYLLGKKTKATTKEGWILKGFTDRKEYIDYYFNLECVAWQPLPQPTIIEAEGETDGK